MPIGSPGSPVFIMGLGGPFVTNKFIVPFETPDKYSISGVTRDSIGVALGGCTVEVYETVSGLLRGDVVSDINGNYSLDVTGNGLVSMPDGGTTPAALTFFVVAYKAGSPDVSGTTINTLVGV